MSDLRNVIVSGRLTWDAELALDANGKRIARFAIACNGWRGDGSGGGQEYADFFPLRLYLRDNDRRLPYLKKGQLVEIEGQLRQARWVEDGKKNSKMYIAIRRLNIKFDRQQAVDEPAYSQEDTFISPSQLASEAFEEEPVAENNEEYF